MKLRDKKTMIETYEQLKEAFCDFNDNNDEFPITVDVLQNTSDYSLVYTGQEPIERKDFELPISHEDFEILLTEFWDYIDWYLEGEDYVEQYHLAQSVPLQDKWMVT